MLFRTNLNVIFTSIRYDASSFKCLSPHLMDNRTRKRVAAYVRWLQDRARRKREYERYLAALEARRGEGGNKYEQVWWRGNDHLGCAGRIFESCHLPFGVANEERCRAFSWMTPKECEHP